MRICGRAKSLLRTGSLAAPLAAIVLAPSSAGAEPPCKGERLALVIGNKAYPDSEVPLKGPAAGARRVAGALRAVGFDVELGEDLTKAKMDADVRELEAKIKPGAAVFLYFSGFGVQAGGHTYLLPVDASIWSEADIASNGVNIDRLLNAVEDKKAAVEVLVIDAARRNPFERRFRASGSAGLAPPTAISGNLVALYSAPPGKTYEPADLSAEPFADDVAREISAPHATAQEAFRQVRSLVARTSKAGQTPWGFTTLNYDLPLDKHDCSGSAPGPVVRADPIPAPPPPVQEAKKEPSPEPAAKPAPPADAAPPPAPKKDEQAMIAPVPPSAPAPSPPPAKPDDKAAGFKVALQDSKLLDETHDLLFEQNLDPGAVGSDKMRDAIRTYERRAGLPDAGEPTQGLLDALRTAPSLSPWGAITVADDVKSWGMSWDKSTRAQAVAEAKSRCGTGACTKEMSFYGKGCGAFALSPRHWIVAHQDGGEAARKAALTDCGNAGGGACRVIGSVCADGTDKTD